MSIDITPFATSPHAPYPVGEVPRAGWYAVEPACRWEVKDEVALRSALGLDVPPDYTDQQRLAHHIAVLARPDLATLAAAYDPAVNDGQGLLVTEEHSLWAANPNSKALGWIRALHAEGDRLWAWIEWTRNGHALIDSGDYVFFSTEYDYTDFRLNGDDTVTPIRLAAVAVTNNPNHTGQIPATNSGAHPARDINTMSTKPKMAATIPARKRNTNSADVDPELDDPDKTKADTNQDDDPTKKQDCNQDDPDPEKTDTNEADDPVGDDDENGDTEGDIAIDLLTRIADTLELDSSATGEDVLSAVQELQAKVSELTEALAAANSGSAPGSDTNSRRYPNMFGRRDTNAAPLRGDKPNRDVNVRVANTSRQVN